jgi:hypothetical protein
VDLKPEEIDPSVVTLYKQRMEDLGKDDPSTFRCLPSGPRQLYAPSSWVRIVQTPAMIVMLYEDLIYRQIFMDGRELPKDPNPSFMGYSVGRWDGDTLVVETTNFKDRSVYRNADAATLKLTERFTRIAPDRVTWEVTVDDASAWTRPWTFSMPLTLNDGEPLMPYECHEGNYGLKNILSAARADEKAGITPADER